MEKVVRVDVLILGERNFPLASTRLPETAVSDLAGLLEVAQRRNPSLTYEEIVRAIWRLGSHRLRKDLLRSIPVVMQNLPAPMAQPEHKPVGKK